ncbi:MAG: serine protease [Sphaerospermopsis sp. SIO1G2]|nr:serine protease [Sphaerospermopsis sp. SIO1G2]
MQTPFATALQLSEINNIAKQITVSIQENTTNDQKVYGSGVIIKKQGNRYTVLTNWHVVQLPKNYILFTNDKQRHSITQKRQLGRLDLAIVEFTSSRNYQVAKIGNSQQLTETTPLYSAGFPAPDQLASSADYRFIDGKVNSIVTKPKEGYGLIISNIIPSGMSGGPILNQDGRLVGIIGRATTDGNGIESFGAIPIHEYQKYANVGFAPPVRNTPRPRPRPTITPPPRNISPANFALAKTLNGHSSDLLSVGWSPDGRFLASGSEDNTIKIWEVQE